MFLKLSLCQEHMPPNLENQKHKGKNILLQGNKLSCTVTFMWLVIWMLYGILNGYWSAGVFTIAHTTKHVSRDIAVHGNTVLIA